MNSWVRRDSRVGISTSNTSLDFSILMTEWASFFVAMVNKLSDYHTRLNVLY